MSQIKTVTTSAGENKISFDAFYAYVWIKNTGDTDVYVSDYSGASAGDEDTAVLPAGEATRLTVKTQDVYVYGATTIEAHAQNFSDVPFSDAVGGGSGGGGSITIDPTPTQGSTNAVSSGGVYTALQDIPQPIDYSTTEQDTGIKWIDGKPVYQKVVLLYSNGSLVSGLTINDYVISGSTIPTNIDTLIDYHGISERGGSGGAGYVDNYAGQGTSVSYSMVPNIANNTIYFHPHSDVENVFIVYEYTKTTDTVG